MPGADRVAPDWDLIEREFRAGIKTVRQIAKERGVSHTAIAKRAQKFGWVQDLTEKIQAATKSKVATQVVASRVSTETKLSDARTVEEYSNYAASVDMAQRSDVEMAIGNSRSQLAELVTLGDPKFREALEAIAEAMDESGPTANGAWKTDKVNEMYRYIISLAGRVKMSKEIAASHGVYLPLQRKMVGLDAEKKSAGEFEEMLRRVQEG